MIDKGERGKGGVDGESGVSRCDCVYIGWINNKVLLCSMEKYTQYPVINQNGKEYFIYIYYIYMHN